MPCSQISSVLYELTLDVWENALDIGQAALRHEALDGATDHGVLAHQDDTLATERLTNLVHLLGGDIVDGDNEDGLVLLDEALELVKVDVPEELISLGLLHLQSLIAYLFADLTIVNRIGWAPTLVYVTSEEFKPVLISCELLGWRVFDRNFEF